MHLNNLKKLILIILIQSSFIYTFDRSFFYRSSSFWDEPRFEIGSLTSLNVQLTGGSTKEGKKRNGHTTSLFGIYGKEKEVPELGQFQFTGAFDLFETNFNLYQNLAKGFFLHFHLPVVAYELFPIGCDQLRHACSRSDCPHENSYIPSINQTNLLTLNESLKSNDISMNSIKDHGLSDSTLFVGWSINYENTNHLDFIDLALQTGVLFPTGRKLDTSLLFDIPLGYNGHWGIPWVIDFALGAYEWLTWGIHNDGVFFFNRAECIPLPSNGTGFLRFKTVKALIKSGPVWRVGSYVKADHLCWGLSLLMAMTFEQKNKSTFASGGWNGVFDNPERMQAWNRLIYQLVVEYDFAQEKNTFNNRIAFLYNHQIIGKRVFSTNILGGYFGLDLLWYF